MLEGQNIEQNQIKTVPDSKTSPVVNSERARNRKETQQIKRERFLENTSRDGREASLITGQIQRARSFYKLRALQSLGYDLSFEEGAKSLRGEPLPDMVQVLTDSLETKKRILEEHVTIFNKQNVIKHLNQKRRQ